MYIIEIENVYEEFFNFSKYSKESKLTVGKTKYETCDVSIKRFEVLIKIKNV